MIKSGNAVLTAGNAGTSWHISHPMNTPYGIIFTNERGTTLYLTHNGTIKELFSDPGCGVYFTLSLDRSTIGFKDIFNNGMQAPALLDISTGRVSLLHPPVPQSGQVSFSRAGAIAYSIGKDVFIRSGSTVDQIPIGSYSNIVALSSDAIKIAYTDESGHVVVMNVLTRETQEISGSGCMLPIWSPVSEQLCYSSLNGNLFVFDSHNMKTYTLGPGADPAWTNDGSALIAVRKETKDDTLTNSDLYQLSYDGRKITLLTATKNINESAPSLGPGNTVLFTAYNDNTLYSAELNKTSTRLDYLSEIKLENPIPNETAIESSQNSPLASPRTDVNAAPYFEVPYVNQVFDTPEGFGNIGESACGPTSAIMVIAYYNLLPPWNNQLEVPKRHVTSWGNYVLEPYHFHGVYFQIGNSGAGGGYGYMWNTSDPYHMMASYYNYHGLEAVEQDAPSLDSVISEVTAGHPYTLCNLLTTAGHIIVLNGVGDKEGTVIANDPYGNANSTPWPNDNGRDVQYDWPGYNNGYQNLNGIAWGVSVRDTSSPSVSDSIVDDLQFNDGFTLNNASPASMSLWLDRNQGYNNHFWYTYTRRADTCTAEWREPTSLQDGNYEVFAYVPSGTASAARYRIFYRGDSATVVLDQNLYKNSWASLGTYPFVGRDSGYVKLGEGSGTAGQVLEFDAMAWSYRSPLLVQNVKNIPTQMSLEQNYPNPFNPSTTVSFTIAKTDHVSLMVYDVLGRVVGNLVDRRLLPGSYKTIFDGSLLPSGVYFCRLVSGQNTRYLKLLLLK